MGCNMGTFLTVILFITFSLAVDASDVPCPGCRNNDCVIGTSMCTTSCFEGYFRQLTEQNKINFTCQKCSSMCHSCISLTNCSKCIDGRWGDTCNNYCPSDCAACMSPTHCTNCREGYYGRGCNQTCPPNCKACRSLSHCTKCRDGFWGDLCNETCPNGCTCHQIIGGCHSCKTGYIFTTSTNNEVICIPCNITNCHKCKTKDECEECEVGWYGDLCNQTCSTGCLNRICTIKGDCVCKNGYFKTLKPDKSFNCHECPKGCAKCKSNSNCSGCKTGYWDHDCSKNCSRRCHGPSCYQSNGQCKNGCRKGLLTLENGTCIDCSRACANCTSGPACTECGEGGVCHELDDESTSIKTIVLAIVGVAGTAYFIIMVVAGILLAWKWKKEGTTEAEPEQSVYHEEDDPLHINMTSYTDGESVHPGNSLDTNYLTIEDNL